MSDEECIEILEKMQFCEHTDFLTDKTFGFAYSEEWKALDYAVDRIKRIKEEQKNDK